MNLTGIIGAFDTEVEPFLHKLENASVVEHSALRFHRGNINGSSVVVVCSGVCKVNAAVTAQVMIHRFDCLSRVIFSGTAGGMDRRLRIGDTVVITESVYHDVAAGVLDPEVFVSDAGLIKKCRAALEKSPPGQAVYYGRTVTGEGFIINGGRKRITERFHPLCVDMETAAAAHVCCMNGVPFLAVRSVTDTEKDVGYGSFYANAAIASKNSFETVEKILNELR